METLDLKIAAATVGIVAGFDPASWVALPDPRGHRVLVSDGERTVVAVLLEGDAIAQANADDYGAALLRGLLPETAVAFPQFLGAQRMAAKQFGTAQDPEIRVSAPLPGTPATTTAFAGSPALVEALAAFLADLHDANPGELAETGLTVLDSAAERQKLLDALDAGAATGHVPSGLLSRWESALENVATWRFFPCPVHGALTADAIRTSGDAIAAISDLGQMHVGDPAADLAAVSVLLDPDAVETLFRTYRRLRTVSDPGLRTRTELRSEIAALDWLLEAHRTGDEQEIADAVALLGSLSELTADEHRPRHAVPYESDDADLGADSARIGEDSAYLGPDETATAEPAAEASPARAESARHGPDTGRPPSGFIPKAPPAAIDEEAASAVPTERIPLIGEDDPPPSR